jgi:transposase
MEEFSKYIGLDVHKETIAVSVAEGNGGEVRYLGEIDNTPDAIDQLIKHLRKARTDLLFCYESGPCGYGIYRQITDLGWTCKVVATSLIPKKAGDRVKTDRRDSMMLARLLRAGELDAVWVPDGTQEALRDLTRAREDMKHLQRQAKQRLLAFFYGMANAIADKAIGRRRTFGGWRESNLSNRCNKSFCKNISMRSKTGVSALPEWIGRLSGRRRHQRPGQ